jgi:hypothetical protein
MVEVGNCLTSQLYQEENVLPWKYVKKRAKPPKKEQLGIQISISSGVWEIKEVSKS